MFCLNPPYLTRNLKLMSEQWLYICPTPINTLRSSILHIPTKIQTNKKKERAQQRLVASIMADAGEKAEHDRIFKKFDANGDGKISAAELGESLKTLGSVTGEDVKRMMAEIDTDGDGYISYQEFTDFAAANRGLMKDVAKIF
ncbi:PREDICTED: probable calcium-binding protein CML28 [Tarenaya hassleriana]|uniref:probable calcium-binding protein CML28 n=1 Tax=Tarenaya hassleriana TaxID=28532 RepID=UPI0008FD0C3C|nr:PREDICTED: probable calcium-binding protein CML28 [Tarenaya hassleriana]